MKYQQSIPWRWWPAGAIRPRRIERWWPAGSRGPTHAYQGYWKHIGYGNNHDNGNKYRHGGYNYRYGYDYRTDITGNYHNSYDYNDYKGKYDYSDNYGHSKGHEQVHNELADTERDNVDEPVYKTFLGDKGKDIRMKRYSYRRNIDEESTQNIAPTPSKDSAAKSDDGAGGQENTKKTHEVLAPADILMMVAEDLCDLAAKRQGANGVDILYEFMDLWSDGKTESEMGQICDFGIEVLRAMGFDLDPDDIPEAPFFPLDKGDSVANSRQPKAAAWQGGRGRRCHRLKCRQRSTFKSGA